MQMYETNVLPSAFSVALTKVVRFGAFLSDVSTLRFVRRPFDCMHFLYIYISTPPIYSIHWTAVILVVVTKPYCLLMIPTLICYFKFQLLYEFGK